MTQAGTVAIVGGAGKVARLLAPLLLERGYTVVPLVRREEQAHELESGGCAPRMLDIERAGVTDFTSVLDGVDAVVFSAGGGPDGNVERKRVVDLGGALATIAACDEPRHPAVRPGLGDRGGRAGRPGIVRGVAGVRLGQAGQ
ncbi:NAD(P)H-binding protein [Salana multivorans]